MTRKGAAELVPSPVERDEGAVQQSKQQVKGFNPSGETFL